MSIERILDELRESYIASFVSDAGEHTSPEALNAAFAGMVRAIRDDERARIVEELKDTPYWSNGVGNNFDVGVGPYPDEAETPTRSTVISIIETKENQL